MVQEYAFSVTDHEAERPWVVLNPEHRSVTLDENVNFFDWAAERWPVPSWTVELAPWQLACPWPR